MKVMLDQIKGNRPITKCIEKGSKVLLTLEPFSIYMLSYTQLKSKIAEVQSLCIVN